MHDATSTWNTVIPSNLGAVTSDACSRWTQIQAPVHTRLIKFGSTEKSESAVLLSIEMDSAWRAAAGSWAATEAALSDAQVNTSHGQGVTWTSLLGDLERANHGNEGVTADLPRAITFCEGAPRGPWRADYTKAIGAGERDIKVQEEEEEVEKRLGDTGVLDPNEVEIVPIPLGEFDAAWDDAADAWASVEDSLVETAVHADPEDLTRTLGGDGQESSGPPYETPSWESVLRALGRDMSGV